jgi:hypothetical protein
VIQVVWGELRISRNGRMLKKVMTPVIFLLLCLDILMDTEADFIKEIRYLSGLMRQNCHDASWRMERLLSKVEQGESLDTRSTSIQLSEARDELQLLMRGIARVSTSSVKNWNRTTAKRLLSCSVSIVIPFPAREGAHRINILREYHVPLWRSWMPGSWSGLRRCNPDAGTDRVDIRDLAGLGG